MTDNGQEAEKENESIMPTQHYVTAQDDGVQAAKSFTEEVDANGSDVDEMNNDSDESLKGAAYNVHVSRCIRSFFA